MSEKTKKIKRINKPALAGLWYTASSVLERGSAVIFTPIYTRLLTPNEYGIYSIFVGFCAVVGVIATLQISGGTVYKGLREFGSDGRFTSSALGLISLSGALSMLLYLLFYPAFAKLYSIALPLALLGFLQVFFNGVRALKISESKFVYGKALPFTEGVFFSLITPLLSVLFIVIFDVREYGRIYASLIAAAIFAIPILFSILKRSRGHLYNSKIWLFLLKYSLPSIPHFFAMSLIWQIGKISVASAFSDAEAGLLSLAISVGLLPMILGSGVHSALAPWITRRLGEERCGRERVYLALSSFFLPFCLMTVLFMLVCPELFYLLASPLYHSAQVAVYPIAASVPLIFLSSVFSSEISYYKKTFFTMLGSAFGAIFNLIFNLLFTFRLGFYFSALLILPTFLIINTVYLLILRYRFKDRELPIGRLCGIYFFFLIFSLAAAMLKASALSRAFLGGAVILILLPRIRETLSLIKER